MIEDAAQVAQHFYVLDYDEEFEPIPGVRAKLVDAGHILGSAAVVLDIQENGRKFRLWFSGDIGRRDLPLVRDPVLPEDVDTLIMECTYGDKPHREPHLAYEELRAVVGRTVRRGGKVVIPAFAVGRTQELVYNFHRMIEAGRVSWSGGVVAKPSQELPPNAELTGRAEAPRNLIESDFCSQPRGCAGRLSARLGCSSHLRYRYHLSCSKFLCHLDQTTSESVFNGQPLLSTLVRVPLDCVGR